MKTPCFSDHYIINLFKTFKTLSTGPNKIVRKILTFLACAHEQMKG